jgi:hypothetical protein
MQSLINYKGIIKHVVYRHRHLMYRYTLYPFSTMDSKVKELKEKLSKDGALKLYDSQYTFSSEKLITYTSFCAGLITGTTIFFTQLPLYFKVINSFVFIPCLMVQIELLIGNTRFIKTIKLIQSKGEETKLELWSMWGKKEVLEIRDLMKASQDQRVKQSEKLNNEIFIIFTNKNNRALYHVPRDGLFYDENIFHNIIEGRTLDKL